MKNFIIYICIFSLALMGGCAKDENGNNNKEDLLKNVEGEWNIVQRNYSFYVNGVLMGETYEDVSPVEINLILDFNADGNLYYRIPNSTDVIGAWTIDANDSLFMVMTEDFEMGDDIIPDINIIELTETSFHLTLTFEYTNGDQASKEVTEYILNKEFSDFQIVENVWEKLELSESVYGGRLWAAASGSKIYAGNASNSGQYDQWFVSCDTESGEVQSLTTNGEIIAGGYGSHLLEYGGELYYFANDGVKYTPTSDSWSLLNYPYEIKRGEAPCAVLDGRIYYLGGRTETLTGQYYDIASDSWDTLSNDMDYFVHHNYATACGFDHKLYVFGGNDDGEKQVSVYDTGTGIWTRMDDAPYETGTFSTVYNNRIYITGIYGMYTYDPATDTWGEGYAWPESDYYRKIILTVGSNLYLVTYSYYNSLEIYKFNY